jgi:phosphate-selective porin OprO/OprP
MTKSNKIAATRIAIAVAAVCASLAMPAVAADNKALLDLMLKKGTISQAEYDQFAESAENEAFKEKRLSDDVSKLNKAAEKSAGAGLVAKNGLGIASSNGEYSVNFTGRIHMDYRTFSQNAGADQSVSGFSLRRARLGFKGNVTKDFDYFFFGDFSSEKDATLDEGYITYSANKELQVRAGKFKMPFSLEQLTSSNNIDFMERSLVGNDDKELIPGKQYGAMVFGSPVSGASYGLAYSSGNFHKGVDTATADRSDFIGRVAVNVAELNGNKDLVTHLGLGYSIGKIDVTDTDSNSATEGKGISKFLAATTARVAGADRTRGNLEAAVAYGPVKVQGEYFDFKYENGATVNNIKGSYLSAVWNITGESHNYSNSSNTFGWIKPKSVFSTAKGGLGAWQVGLRYSTIETDAAAVANSTTQGADATTLGLTWIANDNVRFMANYVVTNFDTAVKAANLTREKAFNVRAQISF